MAPDPRFATPFKDTIIFNHRDKFTQVQADQIVALVAACSQGGAATKVYSHFKKAIVISSGVQTQATRRYVGVEYHGVMLGKDAEPFRDSVTYSDP
ncbi:hypothetical protein PG984_016369 [Apiospora sp. TS-2023a]